MNSGSGLLLKGQAPASSVCPAKKSPSAIGGQRDVPGDAQCGFVQMLSLPGSHSDETKKAKGTLGPWATVSDVGEVLHSCLG